MKARQNLIEIGGGLEEYQQPERALYALPHVINWLDETLPTLQRFYPEADLSPMEQVYDLFHGFVSGADMSYYQRAHWMRPAGSGVWELKILDVRIFGWFHRRGIFIIANIDTMDRTKSLSLYTGYRNDVVSRRANLDLDEPKYLVGECVDVL